MSTAVVARAVRLNEMASMLDDRPRTVQAMAAYFGVTTRTIYYDLATLQSGPFYCPLVTEVAWGTMTAMYKNIHL